MKTIRVLHVIGKMNPGGAETFLMELYRHVDKQFIQFDFLEIQYDYNDGFFDKEIKDYGGNVFKLKINRHILPFVFYIKLYNFFKEHTEHTIIHSHQYTMSGLIVCAAKQSGKTTISHAHAIYKKGNPGLRELYRLIGIKLLKIYSDYYFGCSEDALYSLTGMHSDGIKAFIIKNAIDADKFYFSQSERNCQREKYGITDEKVIGCVGRFSTVKNQLFLLQVFSKAVYIDPKLMLVFVGEGEKEEEAKRVAQELGIYKQCLFFGLRSDVYNIINMFDAFCLPSLNEGLGIVYIEAQCNGLYCIAPLETVPREADIGSNSLKRVSISAGEGEWASALIEIANMPRVDNNTIRNSIIKSGYNITSTAKWIQEFYVLNSGPNML